MPEDRSLRIGQHGEGSYEASREFNRKQSEFVEDKPEQIRKWAREAARALSGPGAEELVMVEAKGKKRATK